MSDSPSIAAGRGCAPGKVILLGEHAVVYGRTALAGAIDRHVTVQIVPHAAPVRVVSRAAAWPGEPPVWDTVVVLDPPGTSRHAGSEPTRLARAIACAFEVMGLPADGCAVDIAADLPVSVGLGSSAALSVALVRALTDAAGRTLDAAAVCARAFEIERIFHGFPSGIDNTVATYGGAIAFTRGEPVRPLALGQPVPLVVARGRAPRETQRTVTALRRHGEADREPYERLFDEVGTLVAAAERALAVGDFAALGGLMDANHRVLQHLGVSTDELDEMVTLARRHGALGAKLTGGGGGGAVIGLCPAAADAVVAAYARAGWRAFTTTVGRSGREVDTGNGNDVDRHAGLGA